MKFLIATAALFSMLVAAKPARLSNRDNTPPPGCKIIGDAPTPVRQCASESCPVVWSGYYPVYYYPGEYVVFKCYIESDTVENTHDGITSYYWDSNGDGFFPEAYVDPECAATIDQLCDEA